MVFTNKETNLTTRKIYLSLLHLGQRAGSLEKTLMLGKSEGRRKRGWTTEDEMVGWHHRLDGLGFGQGGLACCFSWGRKESDMTE